MVKMFKNNTKRYLSIFNQAIDKVMPKKNKHSNPDDVSILQFRKLLKDIKIF